MDIWSYLGQLINFIVFVVILYYLLYRPVGRIMRERREAQERDRRAAERERAEAEQAREEARQRADKLEKDRDEILRKAREQADQEREERLKQVEQEARERLERFRRVLEQERDEALENLREEVAQTVVRLSRSVLADAADTVNDRALDRADELLDGLSDQERKSARQALSDEDKTVRVRAAAELSDAQQDRVRERVAKALDLEGLRVQADVDPDLVAGVAIGMGPVQVEAHWRARIDKALRAETSGQQGAASQSDEAQAKESQESESA